MGISYTLNCMILPITQCIGFTALARIIKVVVCDACRKAKFNDLNESIRDCCKLKARVGNRQTLFARGPVDLPEKLKPVRFNAELPTNQRKTICAVFKIFESSVRFFFFQTVYATVWLFSALAFCEVTCGLEMSPLYFLRHYPFDVSYIPS
jgi:hypothetical protein